MDLIKARETLKNDCLKVDTCNQICYFLTGICIKHFQPPIYVERKYIVELYDYYISISKTTKQLSSAPSIVIRASRWMRDKTRVRWR